jgi:hypothetical protein
VHRPDRYAVDHPIDLHITVGRVAAVHRANGYHKGMDEFDVVQVDVEATDVVGWARHIFAERAFLAPDPTAHGAQFSRFATLDPDRHGYENVIC